MEDNATLVIFSILALIIGGLIGGLAFSSNTVTEVEVPFIITEYQLVNCTAPEFVLTESDYNNNLEEDKALELALESIDSRDFEKAVFAALVDFNESIESYKDITKITYEYDVDGNEVEFDKVKIYYFIDGDEDENEKARLNDFTIEIDDLNYEDLSDAEVNEDYLDSLLINKVY